MTGGYEFNPAPDDEIEAASGEDVVLGYAASLASIVENPDHTSRRVEIEHIYQHAHEIGGLALGVINTIYEQSLKNMKRPRDFYDGITYGRETEAPQDSQSGQSWPVPGRTGFVGPTIRQSKTSGRKSPPGKLEFMPRQEDPKE